MYVCANSANVLAAALKDHVFERVLEEQERKVISNPEECSVPAVGRLVEFCGFECIAHILALTDSEYEFVMEVAPALSQNDRVALLDVVRAHVKVCRRCQEVSAAHTEVDSAIADALARHRHEIQNILTNPLVHLFENS